MRDLAAAVADGPTGRQLYQRARVTAVSGSTLTVKLLDTADALTVLALVGPAYAVNDIVVVARDGSSSFVVGRLAAAAASADPDPAPTPDGSTTARTVTVLPATTGTWRDGWRSGDDVRQGDWNSGYGINTGAAFYGRQLRSLNADLSRPRSAVLRYRRGTGGVFGAQTPTFWTLSQSVRPSGAPTRLSSSSGTAVAVNRSASWSVPGAFLDALLSGSAGGLGIHVSGSSPYIVLDGRSSNGQSFALTVTYYPA